MTDQLARWCVGWRRNPHVPSDEALIATNIGPDIRLCRTCWNSWITTDRTDQEKSHGRR